MTAGHENTLSKIEPAFEGDPLPLIVSIGEELRTACTEGLEEAFEGNKLPRLTRLALATMEPDRTEMLPEVERLLLWSIVRIEPDEERRDGMRALFGIGPRWGRDLGPMSLNTRRMFAARRLGYAGALLLNQRGEGEERRVFRSMRAPLSVLASQKGIRE